MIKTILSIIKYTIVLTAGAGALFSILWILNIVDWSLFAWVKDIFPTINWDIEYIFNYPNTWILISYVLTRDMIFWGLDLVLHKVKRKGDN